MMSEHLLLSKASRESYEVKNHTKSQKVNKNETLLGATTQAESESEGVRHKARPT